MHNLRHATLVTSAPESGWVIFISKLSRYGEIDDKHCYWRYMPTAGECLATRYVRVAIVY